MWNLAIWQVEACRIMKQLICLPDLCGDRIQVSMIGIGRRVVDNAERVDVSGLRIQAAKRFFARARVVVGHTPE